METLREQILEILNKQHIGSMVTVRDNKPYARYMTFTNEGFTLFAVTEEDSAKIWDLENNPHTHILYGYTLEDKDAPYLEIEGKVTDFKDDELKLKVTNFFRNLFNKDASDMITIQIEPTRIRLMNKTGQPPQELEYPFS